MDTASFWERTNALIKLKRTTQRVLSKECGFTERRIETLVSTGRLPDAVEVFLIAQALGTSVEFLVSGKEPENSQKAVLDDLQAILYKYR
jgi:transcriptional regulator with XRE-family HTH domain